MTYLLVAAVLVTAAGAWTDWRTGQIPNWLTFGGGAAGVLGHFVIGTLAVDWSVGLVEAGFAFGGTVFCALVPMFMFYKGAMGGGDVKMFAAVGALCQPLLGIEAEMYAFVVAAVVAPARLAYEGKLLRVLGNSLSLAINPLRPEKRRREMPPEMFTWFRLGPAIFVGTVLLLLIHGRPLPSP